MTNTVTEIDPANAMVKDVSLVKAGIDDTSRAPHTLLHGTGILAELKLTEYLSLWVAEPTLSHAVLDVATCHICSE